MVYPKRWFQVAAMVCLGLAGMCATARAQVFSAPKNVSNNSDFSFTPQVAVDSGGNVFVVWEDDAANNNNILFSRSIDGGASFLPLIYLSDTSGINTSGFPFNPRMAVDTHGNINVVWVDDAPGNLDVFFSRSTDGGGTFFSTPVNLSLPKYHAADYSTLPQIAVDTAGNINVVWESNIPNLGNFIVFTRSADGGATFSTPVIVSNNPTGSSITPQIAVDKNGNINVVWEDDITGHSDISFSRSADMGATFSAAKSLSQNMGNSNSPQIAVDLSGNINVVWANDDTLGRLDIFFSRSTDNGANFSATNVSNTGTSTSPLIALDAGGNINVVWQAPTNNPDIFFVRSNDGGATFFRPQNGNGNVSNSPGFSSTPWMSVDASGGISLSWEDTTPGNGDIFFARSLDAGATFSPPVNVSGDSGLSLGAQIAVDKNGNTNVVWQDRTPGPSQILFSRLAGSVVANQPPVAVAGPDQRVQSTGNGGTLVQLDGSKSSDPDGDVLSFVWMDETNNVVGTMAVVQLTLSVGTHTFTLKVTDPGGLSSTDTTHVTVTAVNHPPVASAGPDQSFACAGPAGISVKLDGSKSSDPDGDALSFVWMDEANNVVGKTAIVQLTLTAGMHTFTLTVTDPGGLTSMATTHVTIQNATPPTLQVSLFPNVLWPPNHRLVQISATVQTSDTCDPNLAIQLVSITSNEPDNGLGDGDQPNDIQAVGGGPVPFGTDVRSFLLRAERSGTGTGRIYTVAYMAVDAVGNSTLATAQVRVGPLTSDASWTRSRRRGRRSEREDRD